MSAPPLDVTTLKTHSYTDTSQTGVSSADWNWATEDVQRVRKGQSFVIHPDRGLWHYARGAMRPAMDRGVVIASGTRRLVTFDDVTLKLASPAGSLGPHTLEYGSTGENGDAVHTYDSTTGRIWLAPPPAISGEWWLVHLYVLMPGQSSVVTSGFNGWELRHGTSGRRVQGHTNPAANEPVPISLTIIHQATSTAAVPIVFNLYYTHNGSAVTDARDGALQHRFSLIRLKDGRA